MSAISRYKKGRDQWKVKAVSRADLIRYLKKELARIKNQRDKLKQENRQLQAQLGSVNEPVVISKCDLVWIALQLFCLARIGFRAVSRVLAVLAGQLGIAKAPCPQTIINWVTRLSITRIQQAANALNTARASGWLWVIDASIAMGAGKILTLIAIRADHYQHYGGAPTLQTVHCIGVSVALSWTGQSVAELLQKAMAAVGRPLAIIKDGGTDLAKALRVLAAQGIDIIGIDDLSHVVANLLKHRYQNHHMFKTFMSTCGKASKYFKQSILACLAPPKVSTKARFMNLHRLVTWADRILRHSPTGRAAKGSLVARLREGFDQLPQCKAFIAQFLRDASALLQCQSIIKANGLSVDTVEQCQAEIQKIPQGSPVRNGISQWMEKHLQIARQLGLDAIGMPGSSDILEATFATLKSLGAAPCKDANRLGMHVPAICGVLDKQDAQRVLTVTVAQQNQVVGHLNSLTRQRRQILPNPGNLTDSVLAAGENLTLLPGPKTGQKSHKINIISDG